MTNFQINVATGKVSRQNPYIGQNIRNKIKKFFKTE